MTQPLLNFLDYRLVRTQVDPDVSFAPNQPQRAKIQASFSVGRDPAEKQHFEVTLNASIHKGSADENVAYAVDFGIIGEFWANLQLTSHGIPATIVMNALTQLYGVARGIIGQLTAGGVHDRFVLPSVTFNTLLAKAVEDSGSNVITDQQHSDSLATEPQAPEGQREQLQTVDTQQAEEQDGTHAKPPLELVARLHGVLLSIQEFDSAEVRPRVDVAAQHTLLEECIIGTYLRTLANVRTLMMLKDASTFQAIAMLSRALFELAVDIRLQQQLPDAAEKVMAFVRVEKLRAARRTVESARKTGSESEIHERFINEQGAEIEKLWQLYWPKQKQPPHWTGLDLRSRVQLLKAPFDAMYDSHYKELSWYVHTGLTGVANLEAYVFPIICGTSYEVAIESYRETLRAVIGQLNLRSADSEIEKKLELARLLPFTSGPSEAAQLRHEVLGY